MVFVHQILSLNYVKIYVAEPTLHYTNMILCIILLLYCNILNCNVFSFQQFGPILDVEIIFNERGSKVSLRRPQAASHPCQPISDNTVNFKLILRRTRSSHSEISAHFFTFTFKLISISNTNNLHIYVAFFTFEIQNIFLAFYLA